MRKKICSAFAAILALSLLTAGVMAAPPDITIVSVDTSAVSSSDSASVPTETTSAAETTVPADTFTESANTDIPEDTSADEAETDVPVEIDEEETTAESDEPIPEETTTQTESTTEDAGEEITAVETTSVPAETTVPETTTTTAVTTRRPAATTAASPAVSVNFSESSLTLDRGETFQLATTISDFARDKSLRFYSLNMNVATISQSGLVTANGVGSTVLTAINDDSGAFDTVSVTVTEKAITATEILTDFDNITVGIGKQSNLSATVLPAEANQALIYHSDNSEIVSVDASGFVLGVKEGTANVVISTADGTLSESVQVTVENEEIVTTSVKGYLYLHSGAPMAGIRIALGDTAETITDQTGYFEFKDIVSSEYPFNMDYDGKSYNGSLNATESGEKYYILKDENLSVYDSLESVSKLFDITAIEFTETNIQLKMGETCNLIYDYTPNNVEILSADFQSSNDSVASVSIDGTVTAKKIGSAEITLRLNNSEAVAVSKITVTETESRDNSLIIIIIETLVVAVAVTIFLVLYKRYRKEHSKEDDF